jgi:hypothetical protein
LKLSPSGSTFNDGRSSRGGSDGDSDGGRWIDSLYDGRGERHTGSITRHKPFPSLNSTTFQFLGRDFALIEDCSFKKQTKTRPGLVLGLRQDVVY